MNAIDSVTPQQRGILNSDWIAGEALVLFWLRFHSNIFHMNSKAGWNYLGLCVIRLWKESPVSEEMVILVTPPHDDYFPLPA